METQAENVVCIYHKGRLMGIIKRDLKTGKKIISVVTEASVDEIVELINPEPKTP